MCGGFECDCSIMINKQVELLLWHARLLWRTRSLSHTYPQPLTSVARTVTAQCNIEWMSGHWAVAGERKWMRISIEGVLTSSVNGRTHKNQVNLIKPHVVCSNIRLYDYYRCLRLCFKLFVFVRSLAFFCSFRARQTNWLTDWRRRVQWTLESLMLVRPWYAV